MKRTKGGKALAPVVDIMPQLCVGFHDYVRVREEMRLLKTIGFERVYFVLSQPGYPMFSCPWLSMMPPDKATENHLLESVMALGDPNWAYMCECKRQGMEAWAIIKPYESGGGATIPHGTRAPFSMSQVETVGGEQVFFDTLLTYHPDMRVQRKPEPESEKLDSQPITELEIAFYLDAFQQRNGPETCFEFEGMADGDVKIPGIALWVSKDNGRYVIFNGTFDFSSGIEYREIKDTNGFSLFDGPKRCLTLRIKGFKLPAEYRYIAVTLSENENLYTIPFSMIKAFTPLGEIPVTSGIYVRSGASPEESSKSPEERVWGLEHYPVTGEKAAKSFMEWGFEFEWYGNGRWGNGWCSSPVFGIGRGKLPYMKGLPCEACNEVREYWLEQVERVVTMGYDGIDFRLQNHSGMVGDYVNYGYNKPIIDQYRKKHGVDILKEKVDPMEIMRIRGEYFLMFLEQAADIIHSCGKKVQIHLNHCHEEPRLSTEDNELGFWAMPKILLDWGKAVDLADEITLKDYHHNHYKPEMAEKIKTYAVSKGKRVWTHCYISQGNELNDVFFDSVESDDRVGGILLYEVCHSLKNEHNTGLIEQYGPVGYYEPNINKLRSIMDRLEFG